MKEAISFLLLIFGLVGTPRSARAEYRVFNLKITTPSSDPTQEPSVRYVLSTLDPEQYRLYYPVYPQETLSYTQTWRCFGRTDSFKDFCPNPRAPANAAKDALPDGRPATSDQISPSPATP